MPEKFFDEQTEQSEVKAALVAKYFPAYMGVIGNARSGTAATASPISTCSPGRGAQGWREIDARQDHRAGYREPGHAAAAGCHLQRQGRKQRPVAPERLERCPATTR